MRNILAALGKIGVLGLILCAFALGLAGTVYLSLRSPNVDVPDVTNKDFREGRTALEASGLSIRERAKRFKSGVEPGVILDQFPRGGAVVKQGQTVAVIISRAPREGESPTSDEIVEKEEEKQSARESANSNQNRERRRTATNRNTNANTSPNVNANNANAATSNPSVNVNNTNRPANQNGNRNANAGRNANPNDNRAGNGNNRSANNSQGANNSRNSNRRSNQ